MSRRKISAISSFFVFLYLFFCPLVIHASENRDVPAAVVLEPKNALFFRESSADSRVESWEIALSDETIQFLGLNDSNGDEQTTTVISPTTQYITQVVTRPGLVLQGKTPFFFTGNSSSYQINLDIVNPTRNQVITLPDSSGEVSLLGQSISGDEVSDNSIDLLTKTTGIYVQDILVGNGIVLDGDIGQGWKPEISLGDLTADWVQSGAYDIVLNNPESKIKIMSDDGSSFAVLDVGDLSSDVTYTLTGSAGSIITNSNYESLLTGFLQGNNNLSELSNAVTARSNLGLGSIATESATSVLRIVNNLAELEDLDSARDNLGLSSIVTQSSDNFLRTTNDLSDLSNASLARNNLGLGSVATENVSAFLQGNNNLSELSNAVTARSNLGLGDIATQSIASFIQSGNNLSDLSDLTVARTNLGLGSIATESASSTVRTANNLSDLEDFSLARSNLGLGSIATENVGSFLQGSNNLSDVTNSGTARTNLGLGDIATQSIASFLQSGNDLSDIENTGTARINLGLGSIATESATAVLRTTNNLADLGDLDTARSNLGLSSIVTQSTSSFLQTANNLSDLSNATTSRLNLGLGSIATQDSDAIAITGGTVDGVAIGTTTPASAVVTTLSSSGNTTLATTGNLTLGNPSGDFEIISSGIDISQSGSISNVSGYTQTAGDFGISGSGSFSTGTGSVTLNGSTTVSSGNTLSVASADGLTVGGNIVPQTVTLAIPMTASLVDQNIFIADNNYQLQGVQCVYSVKATLNGSLQITVETGNQSPGSGINQLSSVIDLSVTTNTVLSGSIIGTPTTITSGDKVSLDLGGALLGLLGTCTVTLKRV